MNIVKVIIRFILGGATLYLMLLTLYKKSFGFQDFDNLVNTGFIAGNSFLLTFISYHFSQLFYDLKKKRKCVKILYWLNCIPVITMNIAFVERLWKHQDFSTTSNQVLVLAPLLLAFHVYDLIYYQVNNKKDDDLKDIIDF